MDPTPQVAPRQRSAGRSLGASLAGLGRPAPARFALTLLIAVLGYIVAKAAGTGDLSQSSFYLYAATALLAVGLYGSTYGISLAEARRNVRTVVAAVTLGVLGKSVLISGVMFLLFHRPVYLVLGVAVAQIDPLSVAAMNRRSGMSKRARTILTAWASFDDPVTVLITIYAAIFALRALGGHARAAYGVSSNAGALGYFLNVGANVAFAGAFCGICMLANAARRRRITALLPATSQRSADPEFLATAWPQADGPQDGGSLAPGRAQQVGQLLAVGVLAGVATIAVWRFWMFGLALIGLFFRPKLLSKWLDRAVMTAFVLVAFALGMLLAHGIDVVPGMLLGVTAFGAQSLTSLALTRKLPKSDRVYLALGQQNGITAILLALLLQPLFPQASAIIGPAILTVNALHLVTNAVWNHRHLLARPMPVPEAGSLGCDQQNRARLTRADDGSPKSGPVDAARQPVERVPHVGTT
jgi:hypothetical protein